MDNIDLKTILNINMIISMPCIIITIFVYSWLPELCNIHGKCLVCYLIFLGCSNVLTVIGEQYIGKSFHLISFCLILCMIQWMHVITFDIWRNLKSFRWNANRKLSERKRFCLYALYVCSTPFVLLGTLILMRHYTFDAVTALYTCYAFFIIISIINVSFLMLIVWNIVRTKNDVNGHRENHRFLDRFNVEKQRFALYFRMFIVTGIFTSFAVISNFLFDDAAISHGLDVFLSVQPIFLFILLVLKRTTIEKIRKRWKRTSSKVIVIFHRDVTPASSTTRTGSIDV